MLSLIFKSKKDRLKELAERGKKLTEIEEEKRKSFLYSEMEVFKEKFHKDRMRCPFSNALFHMNPNVIPSTLNLSELITIGFVSSNMTREDVEKESINRIDITDEERENEFNKYYELHGIDKRGV